jgi:chromosome segregation ATPase
MKTNRLNNKVEELMSEKQASQKTISDLNKKLEDIIKENGKLEERSLIIKEKYQQEESVKSTSNEIVESLTNQCNEMNIKLKEIMNLKSTLEDEVTQKNDRLYAQKRDIQNLNDQVLSLKNKNSDLEMTITKLEEAKFSSKTSANDEMIKELQKILDNKIIEINSLNETLKVKEAEIISLNERLSALEYSSSREKQANLSQERKVSTNLNSEQILDRTIKNLKEELSSKTKSLKNLEATLFNLRKLNKDLNFKLDKMNKIYQQQRISASPSNSRKSSEAEIGSTGDSDLDSKLSYIKNVLIGFIEHRDQRQQLLPVISMLLKFNTEDQKILMSLK